MRRPIHVSFHVEDSKKHQDNRWDASESKIVLPSGNTGLNELITVNE